LVGKDWVKVGLDSGSSNISSVLVGSESHIKGVNRW